MEHPFLRGFRGCPTVLFRRLLRSVSFIFWLDARASHNGIFTVLPITNDDSLMAEKPMAPLKDDDSMMSEKQSPFMENVV